MATMINPGTMRQRPGMQPETTLLEEAHMYLWQEHGHAAYTYPFLAYVIRLNHSKCKVVERELPGTCCREKPSCRE